jgi:hypothetical protein
MGCSVDLFLHLGYLFHFLDFWIQSSFAVASARPSSVGDGDGFWTKRY